MPMPVRPPDGVAQLNDNARTVISKRYLIKDASGSPTEQPEEMFWRVASTVAEGDRRYGGDEHGCRLLCADDAAPLRAELSDTHERRTSARTALGVLRSPR